MLDERCIRHHRLHGFISISLSFSTTVSFVIPHRPLCRDIRSFSVILSFPALSYSLEIPVTRSLTHILRPTFVHLTRFTMAPVGSLLNFFTGLLSAIQAAKAQAQSSSTPTRATATRSTVVAVTTTPSVTTTPVVSPGTTLATSSVAAAPSAAANNSVAAAVFNGAVDSKILIIVRDAYAGQVASSGLNGYGIPFEILTVPQSGIALPTLNTTAGGNYGGFIVAGQVSYDMGGGNYQSALTAAQWQLIYDYQVLYGVRMVQYDVCK
jgi:hypothetical protein